MKRSSRKRHRPEDGVTKLGRADEALPKAWPLAEVAQSLRVPAVTLRRWRASTEARSGTSRFQSRIATGWWPRCANWPPRTRAVAAATLWSCRTGSARRSERGR